MKRWCLLFFVLFVFGCASADFLSVYAVQDLSGVSLAEFKVVLINAIISYFSVNPSLSTAELKDMVIAYFAAGDVIDLSSVGKFSGEKLIDIYNKAKGGGVCSPSCVGKVCGGDGCGGSCGSCSSGQTCINGQCTSTCTNECSTSGAKQCSGSNAYQTCGDYDSDSCLEWSSVTQCSSGQTCSDGQCIESCTNECSSDGIKQCASSTSYKVCGNFDSDSCLEWSSPHACPSGQSCSSGQCTTNPPASFSLKKGVGLNIDIACDKKPDPETCYTNLRNMLNSMGISWFYNWARTDRGFQLADDEFGYVPMVGMAGSNSDRSYTQDELNQFVSIAKKHPGSYWLIWNEPDYATQANIPVGVAAKIYKPLREAIKTADPNAKMIIGGTAYTDYWNRWAQDFRNNYKNIYGVYPEYEGWHGHYYVCYDVNYNPDIWRSKITIFRNWINANGGGEFWLTEFGCLNYWENKVKIINEQLTWMETYSGIQRYAWFAAGPDTGVSDVALASCPSTGACSLTYLGKAYADYP